MTREETEVPMKTLIQVLAASITIITTGLIIYLMFRDQVSIAAILGLIIIFAGVMSLTLLPLLIVQRKLKGEMVKNGNCVHLYLTTVPAAWIAKKKNLKQFKHFLLSQNP